MKRFCFALCALTVLCAQSAFADIAQRATRFTVAGIDVVAYPTAVPRAITLLGALPAGDASVGSGNRSVPGLTAMMLERGTVKQDQFAIASQLESAGATLEIEALLPVVNIKAQLRRPDLGLVLGILAEQLRTPAFDAREFEKARQQYIGALKTQLDSSFPRATDAFFGAVYPEGHPSRPATLTDKIAAAQSVTLEQVKAFHRTYYGPAHLKLVFAGDVSVDELKREIRNAFGGWKGGKEVVRASQPATKVAARTEVIRLAEKPTLLILMGQSTGLHYSDPDALALRVGTAIFGEGFTGRLMSTVRDTEGLTYGIGALVGNDTFNDGIWFINATFAPSLLEQGVASTRRELQKWWSEGVTAEELAKRKRSLIGSYEVERSNSEGIAVDILNAIQRGYDLKWLDEYPKAIEALTLEQVNAAIRKHIDPNAMILIEAGTPPGSS